MFKRSIAILLILALTASSFQRFVVDASFALNQKYIAKNLCVNKNRPWLHCNGKCYFMRKIKEAEQREANDQKQIQKSLLQEVYVSNYSKIIFHTRLLRLINTPYAYGISVKRAAQLFRPPKSVS